MPAQLLALNDGPSILLDKPILLLGRHPECDIQIDSRKISRRHCCIAQVSDYLVIRDLGSTNGIRINGIRVVEGRLASGDELTIGNHRYRVTWDAVPASPNPVQPGRRKTVRAPAPLAAVDDDVLESCEEPVPLAEPPDAADGVPSPASPPNPDLESPPAAESNPVILPDDLELMPNSDVFPKLSPHQSGSHPPA